MDEELRKLLSEYPEFSAEEIEKADRKTALIVLVNGTNAEDKSPFWSFLGIPPTKLIEFKKAQVRGEPFFIEDYGEILATGGGKEPPEEIIKEMHEKFGLDPDFEKKAIQEFNRFKAEKQEEKKTNFLMKKIEEMKKKAEKKDEEN